MSMVKLTDELKLEGASDAIFGLAPISVAAAGTGTSAVVDMGALEKVCFVFLVGVSDTVFTHTIWEDELSTMAGEAAVTDPAAVTHAADEDGLVRFICMRASQLTEGCRFLRSKSVAAGGAAGLLAVQIIGAGPRIGDADMTLGHV